MECPTKAGEALYECKKDGTMPISEQQAKNKLMDDWSSKLIKTDDDPRGFPEGFVIGEDNSIASLPLSERFSVWNNLTPEEKNIYGEKMPVEMLKRMDELGIPPRPINTGNLEADMKDYDDKLRKLQIVTEEASNAIKSLVDDLKIAIGDMLPQDAKRYLVMEALKVLYVQENEAMRRQLGDHGIKHLRGDAEMAMQIASGLLGGELPQRERAKLLITSIWHDTGYLAEPARYFLDSQHPDWSANYFEKHIRPMIDKALEGKDPFWGEEIEQLIRTHDATTLNFGQGEDNNEKTQKVVETSFRIADNLALFQREKLPPLFRYVSGNKDVLMAMGRQAAELKHKLENGEISDDEYDGKMKAIVEGSRAQLIENVNNSDFPPKVKEAFMAAAREVGPKTPKFTFGMMAGDIEEITVERSDERPPTLRVMVGLNPDEGFWGGFAYPNAVRQFNKFAEAYGAKPPDDHPPVITFSDENDNPILVMYGKSRRQ